ncbi:copper resistance protein NlpE [Tsuneonella sp. YG55]|uniref:Copper resistance protein NlpE n=1 Tax=Tsuneonella litorea TaxID=2976475 RepID=A0A9X2W2V1_9SPHN|nr:copper resistance protein NlpE [Tsuneonella litorea]MCT2559970.1 copper resistance protein NlpE [Tsuneonella litorea]
MRLATALPLAAPLALALAACGDTAPADTADTDTAGVDVNLPQVDPRFPSVAPDARTSVNYAGTYAQPVGGGERAITLRTDGTYVMRDPDGTETSGTYNWYDDNSRILIKAGGENQVYAIADGALYRMPDENASTTGTMTEAQTYRRVIGPGGPMGASGSAKAGDASGTTQ